jgi:hypothetical protein
MPSEMGRSHEGREGGLWTALRGKCRTKECELQARTYGAALGSADMLDCVCVEVYCE